MFIANNWFAVLSMQMPDKNLIKKPGGNSQSFAVGGWLVQPEIDQISTTTETVYLRPQLMEVLVYLADLQGQVATLESIHDDLWSGKVVSSGTIYNCIAELRQALAKDGKNISYIETIPKKGYRLAAPIVAMPMVPAGDSHGASVAILPLSNRSNDPAIEYLCNGLAEEILHRLSKVSGLKVFSAFSLKKENLDPRVIGLRFGVQMVLIGSLQQSGKQLRLTFRLEQVANGETVWSDRYDQEISDIFALQDTVAKQVVNAMSPALDIGEAGMSLLLSAGTQSLEAFNAFLLGNHAESTTTTQGYDEAIECFEQAVSIDPSFARAHYRLYLASYMKRRLYGMDSSFLDKARIAAANAKQQGYQPPVPWIHIQRRLYRETQPNIKKLAQEAIDKILHPDPQWGSFAYEQLSWVLPAAGYFQATVAFAKHMLDSPLHNFQDSDAEEELPAYYAAAGQFENALRQLSSLIQKDPNRPFFRMERSLLYSRTGQFEYAMRDIDELADGSYRYQAQAFYYFWQDKPDRVGEMHQRNCAISDIHPNFLLHTYCLVGNFDAAMEQYARAVNSLLRGYVDFGPLRAVTRARLPATLVSQLEQHSGFVSLLEKEGIDDAWRNKLMEQVNELAGITGIRIAPNDGT